jgi:hypothetical protein
MEKIRQLLIEAQNDLLRMAENAKKEKINWAFHKNTKPEVNQKDYNVGFFTGSIKSLEYACKHLTNILEQTE